MTVGPGADRFIENVRPKNWVNPTPAGRYNLVVIGAGSAGLVSSIGAGLLGARVALVERERLGGDCLNTGCVPSKALLASARAATACKTAKELGVRLAGPVSVDFPAVMQRLRGLQAAISAHDSASGLRARGVDVFFGEARFVSRDTLQVAGASLPFGRAIIAAGARPVIPDIPGLQDSGFLTTETLFGLEELPPRLLIVGGGPVGCEMAQAFARFGSQVTLAQWHKRLLPRDDPDAAVVLHRALERDGVRLLLDTRITRIERHGLGPLVAAVEKAGASERVTADALLVATGRRPELAALDLGAAGVEADNDGVRVDERLRTTNPRIYAAGDVCQAVKLSHGADATARLALRNALFFGRAKARDLVIPWCTYTEPQVAGVGLGGRAAAANGARTVTVPWQDMDRAVLDGQAEGFVRIHHDRRGRILGAAVVGAHAGEIIGEVALAITGGLRLHDVAATVHPYPTHGEALKRAADLYLLSRLTPPLRRWLGRYFSWRR